MEYVVSQFIPIFTLKIIITNAISTAIGIVLVKSIYDKINF